MGRSHVWVKRGEGVCGTPADDWGDNLTMIGAIRQDGLLTLCTKWRCSITSRSSCTPFQFVVARDWPSAQSGLRNFTPFEADGCLARAVESD